MNDGKNESSMKGSSLLYKYRNTFQSFQTISFRPEITAKAVCTTNSCKI